MPAPATRLLDMSASLSIQQALEQARNLLHGRDGDAALEAAVLLSHVLAVSRAHLHAHREQQLTAAQQQDFFALITRRSAGEPVAYLTGHREFWSLDLLVNRHTLIPRPETELLVELALQRLPPDDECHVLDLGTGSGAIALAIAGERPRGRVIATDLSPEALAVARRNADRLNITNVTFRQGSWFTPLDDARFDLIVANPPYVAEHDPHLAEGDLPAEPPGALVAGATGLEMITAIINGAPRFLRAGGWLLLEHGYNQAQDVIALLRRAGYAEARTWRDAADIERVSGGRCN
jgi:release factor glutamine methyltransferase